MTPSDDPVLDLAPFDNDLPADLCGAVVVADGRRDDVLDAPPLDDDLNAAPPVSGATRRRDRHGAVRPTGRSTRRPAG